MFFRVTLLCRRLCCPQGMMKSSFANRTKRRKPAGKAEPPPKKRIFYINVFFFFFFEFNNLFADLLTLEYVFSFCAIPFIHAPLYIVSEGVRRFHAKFHSLMKEIYFREITRFQTSPEDYSPLVKKGVICISERYSRSHISCIALVCPITPRTCLSFCLPFSFIYALCAQLQRCDNFRSCQTKD